MLMSPVDEVFEPILKPEPPPTPSEPPLKSPPPPGVFIDGVTEASHSPGDNLSEAP